MVPPWSEFSPVLQSLRGFRGRSAVRSPIRGQQGGLGPQVACGIRTTAWPGRRPACWRRSGWLKSLQETHGLHGNFAQTDCYWVSGLPPHRHRRSPQEWARIRAWPLKWSFRCLVPNPCRTVEGVSRGLLHAGKGAIWPIETCTQWRQQFRSRDLNYPC